jgi:hypothetical protein
LERRSGVAHRKFLLTPNDGFICVMGNHLASDFTEPALFEASRICALTTLLRPMPHPPFQVESSSAQFFYASMTATPLSAAGDSSNNDREAQTKSAILQMFIKG